jgi:hypothetical protein
MASNNEVTAFGDIPKSEEFTAPVLVVSDTILNNTLPKLLNLVSSNEKLDEKIKVCILTAAKINYKEYSDILSSLPYNCIIQKPVTNEELLKIINEVIMPGSRK